MSTHRPTGGEEPSRLCWIKSTRSGSGGGNCVEVAGLADGRRAVRDSRYPNGPALIFTSGEWIAFAAAVKAGRFDH